MNRFERDTAVTPRGEGRYAARVDGGWWIVRGPNGGYVGAIVLRALMHAVGDPARSPRTFTIHYLSPPVEGPAEVETKIERSGRTLTAASARLTQGGKLRAIALAAFATDRTGPSLLHLTMPEVVSPERADPFPTTGLSVPMRQRYESRPAIGTGGGKRAEAVTGGWIRLREAPGPVDAPLLFAYTDAWPPAAFTLIDPTTLPTGTPTVELTVHFRAAWPAALDPSEFALVVFRSRVASEGFVEEDGEVWSRSGVLLAQSRQLALLG